MIQICLKSFAVGVLLSVFVGSARAQTTTRSGEWNLEGTWKLSVGYFNFQQGGGCMVKIPTGGVGAIKDSPITISRSTSGYSIRVNIPAEIQVSENRFVFMEKLGSNTLEWVGTISQEVDKSKKKIITRISGVETCNKQATLPFTFLKENKLTEVTSRKNIYRFKYVRRNFTLAEGVGINGTYSVDVSGRVVGSNLEVYLSIDSGASQIGSLSADGYVQILLDGQPQQKIGLTSTLKNQYLSNQGSRSLILEAEKPLPLPTNGRIELEVFVSPVLNTGSGFVPLEISPSPERFPL